MAHDNREKEKIKEKKKHPMAVGLKIYVELQKIFMWNI